jgi:hypothetical protein
MSNVFGRRAVGVGGGIGGLSARWIVTIAGRGATARLETWDSFLAALSRLITPTLYDALRHAKPSGAIRHYGFPAQLLEALRTAAPLAPRSAADR